MDTSLLAEIRDLPPHIRPRAAEIEAERRVPRDIYERLRSADVVRMFVPRSHGGLKPDLPSGLQVITELSRMAAVWVTATYVRAADACFALPSGRAA